MGIAGHAKVNHDYHDLNRNAPLNDTEFIRNDKAAIPTTLSSVVSRPIHVVRFPSMAAEIIRDMQQDRL